MVKIKLHDNIIIRITSGSKPPTDILLKGKIHKGIIWTNLVVTDNCVILENSDDTILLASDVKLIQVESQSIKDCIYEITGNPDVLLHGIKAIDEGKEREILSKLLESQK
jgi:hypothetical protein